LVIMDMHRFKEVNDKHGHPRGDEVLRVAAATLKKALRTSDVAFRIGGDEFALILPQTDAPQALALSRRVETVFEDSLKPLQLSVTVGMDHGVANYPQDGDNSDDLIRIADNRLYQLKHAQPGRSAESAARSNESTPRSPVSTLPSTPTTPPPAEVPPITGSGNGSADQGTSENDTVPPSPISIETKRTPEKKEEAAPAPTPQSSPDLKPSSLSQAPRAFTTPRKAERVSMTGTNAYAVLGEHGARRARVLDLGFGGVALELDSSESLTEVVLAILHVPILPPVRVNLKPVWSQRTDMGVYRIGCTFVS
jgi:diguanylate cyclase (GGDEF)-like protein